MTEKSYPRLVMLLACAFFLSGFSALLYQVVWQRVLGLFTGSDVRSVTIITGAYLAGLGIGSLIGSAAADRVTSRRAVMLYGLFNLVIAGFAVLSRWLYYDVLFLQGGALAEQPVVMLIVVFVSLLVPTTLMGLSLPFVAKAVVRTVFAAAQIISRIYAVNTLGAGIGSFIAGWVLIGVLGYEGALLIGAGISAAVGVIALLLAGRFNDEDAAPVETRFSLLNAFRLPRRVWGWCALVFTSGFIVISLEIVWFRMLDFVLKSSAYTYGHLLAFFLIGDALGSLYGTRVVHRIRNPRRVFLLIQGAIALYSLLITWLIAAAAANPSSVIGQYIAASVGRLDPAHFAADPAYALGISTIFGLIPFLVLIPPAFIIGFYFPLTQKAIQTDLQAVGQRTGMVEVANIFGNTAGSILTGTAILTGFGSSGALKLIGMLGVVFLLILFGSEKRGRVGIAVFAAVLIGVIVLYPATPDLWAMLHGYQSGEFYSSEDATGVSAIMQRPGDTARIWANGRDQGTLPPYEWHTFIGALPALVHPDPRTAFLIGVGTGGTTYGVGVRETLEHITTVELIGSELDVLREFSAQDARGQFLSAIFSDPRYQFVIGDGRRELAISGARYDVIVIDAVLPWTSHAGLLYSSEFYALVRDHLAPGGIVVQWRASDRVENTFARAFSHVVVLGEIVLLGSDQPIPFDADAIRAALDTPRARAYLAAVNASPEHFTGWLTAAQPNADSANITLDLFPRDEYYLNQPLGEIRLPVPNQGWIPME